MIEAYLKQEAERKALGIPGNDPPNHNLEPANRFSFSPRYRISFIPQYH